MKHTPKKEGANANRIGVPIEHNPYEKGTQEYDAWEAGWSAESTRTANKPPL